MSEEPTETPQTPPPGRRERFEQWLSSKWGFLVIGLLAGIVLGYSPGQGQRPPPSGAGPAAVTEGTVEEEQRTPPPQPEVQESPDGSFTSSCDYVLGDFSEHTPTGFRFVAGAEIENTGTWV